jgi:predicted HD phosphohydrolase
MKPLEALFALYREAGDIDYIGESISQLEHARQAAWLAWESGSSESLVLGAFFHDIGHLCAGPDAPQMDGLGVVDHEGIGAQELREHGLGGEVADLVEQHVQAKRYFCFIRPNYLQRLSVASRGTLDFQGGPMEAEQARSFEAHPLFNQILRLRTWDEAAKVVEGRGLDLEQIESMAIHYREVHSCL